MAEWDWDRDKGYKWLSDTRTLKELKDRKRDFWRLVSNN